MRSILFCITMLATLPIFAQSSEPTKQEMLQALRDADYSFRRFDGLTKRIPFSRWNVPEDKGENTIVTSTKAVIAKVGILRERSGKLIASLYSAKGITSLDLLEITSTLGEVGTELETLSDGVTN